MGIRVAFTQESAKMNRDPFALFLLSSLTKLHSSLAGFLNGACTYCACSMDFDWDRDPGKRLQGTLSRDRDCDPDGDPSLKWDRILEDRDKVFTRHISLGSGL